MPRVGRKCKAQTNYAIEHNLEFPPTEEIIDRRAHAISLLF